MNNQEFISELSLRLGYAEKDTAQSVASLMDIMAQGLQGGKTVLIQDFGSFYVEKKAEHIALNPVSGKRMLFPPELVLNYRPNSNLKEKLKKQVFDE